MNNKAVLYLRLSKEDRNKVNKGDDSESIINQRIMLSDYAMRHNFQVVKIYSDDDESGLYEDRPGFSQMMQDAERGLLVLLLRKASQDLLEIWNIQKNIYITNCHYGVFDLLVL